MSRKSRRPSEHDLSVPAHWSYVDSVKGDCVLTVLSDQLYWIGELGSLRPANLWLLGRVVPPAWDRVGHVDSQPITPREIAWLAAGHVQHHFEIIEKRCEISPQRGPM